MREQRLFADVVSDAIPADFKQYEEPSPELLPAVEWMSNFFLPISASKNELEVTYGQLELNMQEAFISDEHHAKWLLDYPQVKVMREFARFMGSWATTRELCALCGKSSKEAWLLLSESSKHRTRLCIFSSTKWGI